VEENPVRNPNATQSRPLGWYFPDHEDAQVPSDAAVVIPTVLRPCLARALDSVFAQQGVGRIQVLVGVDVMAHPAAPLKAALARRPPHVSAVVLQLPFSTSTRHGGVHPARDGGSLRTVMSFLANSRYVAFLDDDNTWEPDHLASLLEAVQDKCWAYSLRMLVDEETGAELGVDQWHSVGPDAGRFAEKGGLVDPNCLLLDKIRAGRPLGRWAEGPDVISDRAVFDAIRHLSHGRVDRPTVRYGVRRGNVLYKLSAGGEAS
jgi:hypothetical protein